MVELAYQRSPADPRKTTRIRRIRRRVKQDFILSEKIEGAEGCVEEFHTQTVVKMENQLRILGSIRDPVSGLGEGVILGHKKTANASFASAVEMND